MHDPTEILQYEFFVVQSHNVPGMLQRTLHQQKTMHDVYMPPGNMRHIKLVPSLRAKQANNRHLLTHECQS